MNCLSCSVHVISATDLAINADGQIKALYIDGVQVNNTDLPNADNRNAADTITIPNTFSVIAVKA